MLNPAKEPLFSPPVWDLMSRATQEGGRPMDRREFLISTGGMAVAAASASPAAAVGAHEADHGADCARRLGLTLPFADAPQGPAESSRRLAQRLRTMTGARYSVGERTAEGDADMLYCSPHDFASHHPAFAYFGGLPGTGRLKADDFGHWLQVGGGQMLWDDLAAEIGWKPLLAGHMGTAPPLWSRAPIERLSDLAGMPLAVGGLGADVARALGAEPRNLTPDAALGALRDGTIQAAEVGGLLTSLGLGAGRSAAYAYAPGLNGCGTALALHVRLDVWTQLSDADRAIFTAAAAEEFHTALAEARAHERIARETLTRSFGVAFAPWPEDVAEALDRMAEASIAHAAGFDARGARIDRSYMAFRNAVADVPDLRGGRGGAIPIS